MESGAPEGTKTGFFDAGLLFFVAVNFALRYSPINKLPDSLSPDKVPVNV